MTLSHFKELGILAEVSSTLEVPSASTRGLALKALAFYAGKHINSAGRTQTFSDAKITEIADATNALLNVGRRIKFFVDHENSQPLVLGVVSGQVWTEILDEDNIPFASEALRADLEGRLGIFANISLTDRSAIAQYQDGRLKEISAGIDLMGQIQKNAIVEISAVGIQSLVGAGLFSLSMAEALSKRRNDEDLYQIWGVFNDVLFSIRREEEEGNLDSGDLKRQAVDDFADLLKQFLNVPEPVVGLPAPPQFRTNFATGDDPVADLLLEILQESYSDPIETLDSWELEGDTFAGEFSDQISLSQVKRYRFEISPETVQFRALNPDEILEFGEKVPITSGQSTTRLATYKQALKKNHEIESGQLIGGTAMEVNDNFEVDASDFTKLQASVRSLEKQNQQYAAQIKSVAQEREIVDRYSQARARANALFDRKQLTPKFMQDNFSAETTEDVIEQFADGNERNVGEALEGLAKLEAFLDVYSNYATPTASTFGSLLSREPNAKLDPADDEAETYLKTRYK